VLVTPWVVVVGSLAYNELATSLMLATGLLVLLEEPDARRAAAIGVLAAAACGAKLTAAGFVAAPLGALLLWRAPRARWLSVVGAAAAAGTVVLLPYLLGNLLVLGNPLFPLASRWLGHAHWSAGQSEIWASAHRVDLALPDRLVEAWRQWPAFGLGTAPGGGEPWIPQWAALPWAALAGAAWWLARHPRRACAAQLATVVAIQLVFWIGLTHIKSRFMVPSVVPLALLAAVPAAAPMSRAWRGAVALACLAAACVPVAIFAGEGRPGGTGSPAPALRVGAAGVLTGDDLSGPQRRELGSAVSPEIYVNHLLGSGARVLLVGETAPLYYRLDRIAYSTTWDRGPLSLAAASHPDDPRRRLEELAGAGFTHVLVHPAELDRLERSGWLDPALSAADVTSVMDRHARVVQRYGNGVVIYRLDGE
jgi:hypothetical protein